MYMNICKYICIYEQIYRWYEKTFQSELFPRKAIFGTMENSRCLTFLTNVYWLGLVCEKQVYNFNTMLYFLLEKEQITNKNGTLSLDLMVISYAQPSCFILYMKSLATGIICMWYYVYGIYDV